MKFTSRAGIALATLSLGVAALPASAAPKPQSPDAILAAVKQGPYAKIGPLLGNLHEEYLQATRGSAAKTFKTANPVLKVANGRVAIDGVAKNPSALASALGALGATQVKIRGTLVSARVPVRSLGRLAALDSLAYARPVLARTNALTRPVVSQGVASMKADGVGYTGAGVDVGVLSDSYGCNPPAFRPGAPTSSAAEDASNGEVPLGVNVLVELDGCSDGSDEGRAMAQIVHDVAPGATISFHTAFNGEIEFAEGIIRLQEAGSDVIVDDVIYFAEPMFSDGPVAQAVDIVSDRGVPYYSSAGNNARSSYEAGYAPVQIAMNAGGNVNGAIGKGPVVRTFHSFAPGSLEVLQPVVVQSDGTAGVHVLSFQWDQPHLRATQYALWKSGGDIAQAVGAATDLDLVFYRANGTPVPLCPPGVSKGITCQLTGDPNIGGDAVDLALIYYAGPKPAELFYVSFVKSGGPDPTRVKYVTFDIQGSLAPLAFDTKSGTAYGHSNARGAQSIAAASWYATVPYSTSGLVPANDTGSPKIDLAACVPACLNDFSSGGDIPILLDRFGTRLAAPERRVNPSVTGPDGGNSTFFFSDSSYDDDDGDGLNSPFSPFISCCDLPGDEWPNFFGTSASAPHVAGVAALMLEKKPTATPADVRSALESTARPMTLRFTSDRPIVTFPVVEVGPNGYDYDTGFGLVDAAAALEALD